MRNFELPRSFKIQVDDHINITCSDILVIEILDSRDGLA